MARKFGRWKVVALEARGKIRLGTRYIVDWMLKFCVFFSPHARREIFIVYVRDRCGEQTWILLGFIEPLDKVIQTVCLLQFFIARCYRIYEVGDDERKFFNKLLVLHE